MNKSRKIKSLYVVLTLALTLFAVIKFSTIVSLASGSGTWENPFRTEQECIDYVKSQLLAFEPNIEFYYFNPTVTDSMNINVPTNILDAAFEHVGTSQPDAGDYIVQNLGQRKLGYTWNYEDEEKGWAKYNEYVNSSYVPKLQYTITYLMDSEQNDQVKTNLNNAVASLKLDNYTSTYEKVKAVYDYVRLNVTYDQQKSETSHSTYSAAIERKSVCQGYASMLYYMLLKAGIDNRVITGKIPHSSGPDEGHAWNIVNIDGTWYNVDATWDSDNGTDTWFLMSDATFCPKIGESYVADKSHIRDAEYTTDEFVAAHHMTTVDNPFKGLGVSLKYCNVGIYDRINLRFYFDIPEKVRNDASMKVVFTFPKYNDVYGKTYTMADEAPGIDTIDGNEVYQFEVGVPASQMSDVISVQIVTDSGSSEVFRSSVKKYADTVLERGGLGPYSKNVVLAMLKYGKASQVYFNANPSVYADEGVDFTDYSTQSIDTSSAMTFDPTSTDSDVSYYGSALYCRDELILRHYFTLSDGADINDYTFRYRQATNYTPVKSGSYYYIDIPFAYKSIANDACNLRVYKGSVSESNLKMTIGYNPMNYIKKVKAKYDAQNGSVSSELYEVLSGIYNFYYYTNAQY